MLGRQSNFIYIKLNEAAVAISVRAKTPLHEEFARHLHLVANAFYAAEMVLSGERAEGSEEEAIRACLPFVVETEDAIPTLKEGVNHIRFLAPGDGVVHASVNYVRSPVQPVDLGLTWVEEPQDIEDGVRLTSAAHPGSTPDGWLFVRMHGIADAIANMAETVTQRALAEHLYAAASAVQEMELERFSCVEGDDAAIAAFLPRDAVISLALIEAYAAEEDLKTAIAQAEKKLTVGDVLGAMEGRVKR